MIQTRITQTSPERGPGEINLTDLPEKEFKVKVITMLMELQRKMQELTGKAGRKTTQKKTISGRT